MNYDYLVWIKKTPIIQKVNASIIPKQNGCPLFKADTAVINYVRASLYFSFQCISFNAYNWTAMMYRFWPRFDCNKNFFLEYPRKIKPRIKKKIDIQINANV